MRTKSGAGAPLAERASRVPLAVAGAVMILALQLAPALGDAAPTDAEVAAKFGISLDEVKQFHDYRSMTNVELMQMSQARIKKSLFKLNNPKPDQPFGAALQMMMIQSGGPGLPIPENGIGAALDSVRTMRKEIMRRTRPTESAGGPKVGSIVRVGGVPVGYIGGDASGALPYDAGDAKAKTAGLMEFEYEALRPRKRSLESAAARAASAPAKWKWLGPFGIGGRIRAILIDSNDHNTMYVGAVGGGVWKTINGGKNWAPLNDFMANLNVSSMSFLPPPLRQGDPAKRVIFAGTGEGFYNIDAFRGAGLFLSRDGGVSWKQVPASANANFHYVNRIAFTADGKAMLLATRKGIWRSTNFGATDIAKMTFKQVLAPPAGRYAGTADVKCHPSDAKKCVASGWLNRVAYSTDGGRTWRASSGLPALTVWGRDGSGRVELTYARANPNIVYGSADYKGGTLYRSTDGGKTFRKRGGQGFLSGQGWYDNAIWAADPKDANLVVVAGVDISRTTDGGLTMTKISQWWLPQSAHADVHAIVSPDDYGSRVGSGASAYNVGTVYVGTDGGIYKTEDIRKVTDKFGWSALNNNLGITQFYGAAGNPNTGSIVAGAQDNGTLLYNAPAAASKLAFGYSKMFGGDGGYSAVNHLNPNIVFGEYVNLKIHRSVNGGKSSSYIYFGIKDAGNSAASLFIAPFILDPRAPKILLAGGKSLWRTRDSVARTPRWVDVKKPAPLVGGRQPLISAIEARPSSTSVTGSDLIWVGYHTGGVVYKTTNGLADKPTWTRVGHTGANKLPARYVRRIRVVPGQTKTVYVAFGGYTTGNLWKSKDGGKMWSNVSAKLPPAPVHDVAFHPRNPNLVYAATEVGIFASTDGGATWWPSNTGPANVAVYELFWMQERLVAVTHGRGIFWIDLAAAVPAKTGYAVGDAAVGRRTPKAAKVVPVDPLKVD